MANSYKFKGIALATTSETALLTAASTETIIIRSIRLTNNTTTADAGSGAELNVLSDDLIIRNRESSGDIKFLTGSSQNEALRITSAGNVGIGTLDPGSPLEVSGGTALDTATFNSHHANGVLINLQRSGTSKGFLGSGKNIADATGGVDDIGLRSNANLIFTSGGGTERLRLTSAGDVEFSGATAGVLGAGLNKLFSSPSTSSKKRLDQDIKSDTRQKLGPDTLSAKLMGFVLCTGLS